MGSSENLFSALSKYSPSTDSDPEENRFTEAFAFLMNQNKKLLRGVLKDLLKKHGKPSFITGVPSSKLIVMTQSQKQYGGVKLIADMEITDSNRSFVIFIENKISASEHGDEGEGPTQVQKYFQELENWRGKHNFLIYVSRRTEEVSERTKSQEKHFVQCLWSDIYKLIKKREKLIKKREKCKATVINSFLTMHFLEYMGEMGMIPPTRIEQKWVKDWAKLTEFESTIEEMLGKFRQEHRTRYDLSSGKMSHKPGKIYISSKLKHKPNRRIFLGAYVFRKKDYPEIENDSWEGQTRAFAEMWIKSPDPKKVMKFVRPQDRKVYRESTHLFSYEASLDSIIKGKKFDIQKDQLFGFYRKGIKQLEKLL